jgi:hypothetical protein
MLWPFYRTISELGFRRCGTDLDEKLAVATMIKIHSEGEVKL